MKPASICGNFLAKFFFTGRVRRENVQSATACPSPAPRAVLATGPSSVPARREALRQSECSSVTFVSKRIHGAGAHFCFVLHPHVDSQNTALTNNPANFQIKERMCCQLLHSDAVLVAGERLSPTLVSSAEHTSSKKLP